MTEHIRRSHNTNLLLYHLVCPAKRRKQVFVPEVEETLREACSEIGSDRDHVHFLIQTIPTHSPTNIAKIVKSLTAKKILAQHRWIRQETLGSSLWTSGYYISTVGAHGNERVIREYVQKQGGQYAQLERNQLRLFEGLS